MFPHRFPPSMTPFDYLVDGVSVASMFLRFVRLMFTATTPTLRAVLMSGIAGLAVALVGLDVFVGR